MNDNDRSNHAAMDDLLFLLVEGALDREGIRRIEDWLGSGREAKAYYLNFMNDYAAMKAQTRSLIDMEEGVIAIHDEFDAQLWSALAEVEKVSESLPEAKVEDSSRAPIEKVEREKTRRKVSRRALTAVLAAQAAFLCLILFLRISPEPSVEVATVSNSLGTVFGGEASYAAGSRLSNGRDSIWLQKGVLTVRFDYGAEVVIEAPAEFNLNSAENMTLRYGRLYARVPGRSKGFSVTTPTASIIDLGTEFAVKVDFDGASDIHMIKGRASLIPGAKGQTTGESRILTANEARRVSLSGEISDIPVKTTEFIREVNPDTAFLWRGEREVDLADVVGGGNGFGTGRLEYGIDPETGTLAYRDRNLGRNSSYRGFMPVADSPFIDGVFCPEKGQTAVAISSEGTLFTECPPTSGTYWGYVMNSGWFGQTGRAEGVFNDNLQLGGQVYGSREFPAITMHSNLGVTFDLAAIRQLTGSLDVGRFTAQCGVSELVEKKGAFPFTSRASFYVLFDGRRQFGQVDLTPEDGPAAIDLEIPSDVRFLTLLVTEGSDKTYDGDWTLFANPKLHLIPYE